MSGISLHQASPADNECAPDSAVWPIGKKAAFYSCFVVFFLGIFDFIDRQVLAALLPYIKAEWALSDTQLGLLVSIVNIFMAILVLPSAYLIDKWSRKKMIAIMGTVWSLATAACAIAGSYSQLLVARAFIGFGEAGYNPAAQALISAQFPTKYRGTAIALTQVGLSLGAPLGLILGAYIATHWGWRYAFGIVAIPGIFLSIMALFIKDYKSVEVKVATKTEKPLSYPAVIRGILSTPSLLCVFLGAIMAMMHGGAQINWLPSYLEREGGLSIFAASNMAAAVLFASIVSAIISGPVVDMLRRRTKNGTPIFVASACFCATAIYAIVYGVLTPGSFLQLALLMLAQFGMGVVVATGPIIGMDLSHPGARATTAGMLIFCQNLFGFSLGPVVTGFLSDAFDLGTALLVLSVIAPFFVALSYSLCSFVYRKDLDKVECVALSFEK